MRNKIGLVLACFALCISAFTQTPQKPLSDKEQKKQARKEHIAELIKKEEEGASDLN